MIGPPVLVARLRVTGVPRVIVTGVEYVNEGAISRTKIFRSVELDPAGLVAVTVYGVITDGTPGPLNGVPVTAQVSSSNVSPFGSGGTTAQPVSGIAPPVFVTFKFAIGVSRVYV